MVQMVMNAVGFHAASAGNTRGIAQPVRGPMRFQKLVGFAVVSSGYVAIVASLVRAIHG